MVDGRNGLPTADFPQILRNSFRIEFLRCSPTNDGEPYVDDVDLISRYATGGTCLRQRITLAKVGGVAADSISSRLREWSAARSTTDPSEWSSEQWPPQVRMRVDAFADCLCANAWEPPVVYFVQWSDLWSMGDVFTHWLTPSHGPRPLIAYGDRVEIAGYVLPDGGAIHRYLTEAGKQQFQEYEQLILRLRQAIEAWESLVERSVIILVREVLGGLITDQELLDSLSLKPKWLTDT